MRKGGEISPPFRIRVLLSTETGEQKKRGRPGNEARTKVKSALCDTHPCKSRRLIGVNVPPFATSTSSKSRGPEFVLTGEDESASAASVLIRVAVAMNAQTLHC